MGIVSIVFFIVSVIFIPLVIVPIIGLILGIVYKSKKYPVKRGASTAGIVCNSIGIVLPIVTLIALVVFAMNMMGNMEEILGPEAYAQFQEELDRQLEENYGNDPELRAQIEEMFE
jgi:heme/copper-type cytochrome/quinol oxidase subunit 2